MNFSLLQSTLICLVLMVATSCSKRNNANLNEASPQNTQSSPNLTVEEVLYELKNAVTMNQEQRVRQIVTKNYQLQATNFDQILEDGETLLTYAIMLDSGKSRDILIDLGVNINVPNSLNETPLILAAKFRRSGSVSKLLFENARLDEKDDSGSTALLWTIRNGMENEALWIISKGADIEVRDQENKNAYDYASDLKLTKVLELLSTRIQVNSGAADVQSYIRVISNGDYKSLITMVTASPKIVVNYQDVNPLVLVLNVSDTNMATRIADILLTFGAAVDGPKNATTTPLIKAVEMEKLGFVSLYLNEHAKVNAVDESGMSALMHAIQKNNLDLVNILLKNNAVKKYSLHKDGVKRNFNACSIAIATYDTLTATNELMTNEKILERLNCRYLWFR